MSKQVVTERKDIMSISEFSVRYNVLRKKVYLWINSGMIPGELISGVFYPSIADEALIEELLLCKGGNESSRRRSGRQTPRRIVKDTDSFDARMDKSFQEFEKRNS
jgi:hypothetical protein